ncbi:MAG: tetratricopeptide repeat protein [Candidatus Doudnabacteria bacterium]|nr:tetratricopeptide repeat protein [Candidatus Doudnabacteria bacterium]
MARLLFFKLFAYTFLLLFTSSCYRVPDKLEPKISSIVQERYIKQLPSAFPPLSYQERKEEWGLEYFLAEKFAKELDLYRAVTSFKRAEFLLPSSNATRLPEIQYQILLCYYLGKRYEEVVFTFERSTLPKADSSFPAYHDLLVILYESYEKTEEKEKAENILRLLEQKEAETAKKLAISSALINGDLTYLENKALSDPSLTYLSDFLSDYKRKKKSVKEAQFLNTVLPGAGYLYVGQKQSALTSFLLNGLFLAAAYHFFHKGHLAAGLITTSFEAGWYFGGIYGAGEAAKLYNERLYEEKAYPILHRQGLFPVFLLKVGF